MALTKRLGLISAPVVAALVGSIASTACSEASFAPENTGSTQQAQSIPGADTDLCCENFQVGADLSGADFHVEGELQGKMEVFAQAMADVSAVASGTVIDVTAACANIARDLGTEESKIQGAKSVGATCDLAVASIDGYFGASGEFGASGSLKIDYQAPSCSASLSAKASCEAKCDASAECDIEANPPTCEGGKLEVSCQGECTAEAGASIACEGKCEGSCSGSCKADVGATVTCQGKCDGTCTAGGSADGSGIQADGSCDGQCDGTCEMAADAEVTCEGTCQGSCDASCTAEAGASVKCDGECQGDFEPLSCSGGKLEGGCEVEASCEGSCDASASAKAECIPPSVNVVFEASGGASFEAEAQVRLAAAIASLKANLPNILVAVEARGTAFVEGVSGSVSAAGEVVANPGDLNVEAGVCVAKILQAGTVAVGQMKASVAAAAKVTGSLDLG